jgi:uncharacterized protein
MPNLLTPGVYIQEVALGPSPIQGVSTSVAGFVGEAQRGPVSGPPSLVVSFADFQNQFGGYVAGKALAYAVQGFFDNGGQQAFIARVAAGPTAATPATWASVVPQLGYDVDVLSFSTLTVASTSTQFTIRASTVVGITGDGTATIQLLNGAGVKVATLTVVANGVNSTASTLTVTSDTVVPSANIPSLTPAAYVLRYGPAPTAQSATPNFKVTARDPGGFGDSVSVLLTPTYLTTTTVSSMGPSNLTYTVTSTASFEVGAYVELASVSTGQREIATVSTITASSNTVTLTLVGGGSAAQFVVGDFVRVLGWQLQTYYNGVLVENLTGISSNPANTGAGLPSVNVNSQWLQLSGTYPTFGPASLANPTPYLYFPGGTPLLLTGGTDGSGADETDIIGNSTLPRSGLKTLEATDGISIIAAPGWVSGGHGGLNDFVVAELIGQAERKLDRVAVFETIDGAPFATTGAPVDVNALLHERGKWNSQYAAMYAPWVTVLDPLTNTSINVPPSGHVIGAYASTDNLRGVFKAPANVVIQNIGGFSRDIPTAEQDLLNPAGVNVLRNFPGLGNVIWGARTIAADPLWRYVSVRRLFIFIEQSLVQGTRYAVFEPNATALWARLRDSVSNFLKTQWQAGALVGATAQQAYFVRVDETTTTEADQGNGIVNIVVGIAPVKPAEFIVFQIGQAPESVIIAEQAT